MHESSEVSGVAGSDSVSPNAYSGSMTVRNVSLNVGTTPSDLFLLGSDRREPTKQERVTFKGGLDSPFHRWFRLTPSFSPLLVERWLDQFAPQSGLSLLDPFSGAGTTAIVGQKRGLTVSAIEINPFLAFVGATCLNWSISGDDLHQAWQATRQEVDIVLSSGSEDPAELADSLGTVPPPIHNVHRWWRKDVLRKLIALRYSIDKCGGAATDHLRLALAEIVYSTANITLGRLQVAFVDRSNAEIEVLKPFDSVVARMVEDLNNHVPESFGNGRVMQGDSTEMKDVPDNSIDAVFTSPPYPNRYSYVWNTRPHLYLLEFFSNSTEAGDLDILTVGGTWGRATSNLTKELVEPTPAVAAAMKDQLGALHEQSLLMGNYVTKYFNDLDRHLQALRPKVRESAPVGYVVGNSETKGIMIETHDVLEELFKANGFGRVEQENLRARNSGAGLVEVTVTAYAE